VQVVHRTLVRIFCRRLGLTATEGPVVTRPIAVVTDVVEVDVHDVARADEPIGDIGLALGPGVRSAGDRAASVLSPEFDDPAYALSEHLAVERSRLARLGHLLERGLANRAAQTQALDLVNRLDRARPQHGRRGAAVDGVTAALEFGGQAWLGSIEPDPSRA